jgi:hypothetical protein
MYMCKHGGECIGCGECSKIWQDECVDDLDLEEEDEEYEEEECIVISTPGFVLKRGCDESWDKNN